MCVRKHKRKNYRKHFKTHRHNYDLGQTRKLHCSICNATLFTKAYEKHLQSEQHLFGTGRKVTRGKCQLHYDGNYQHNCQRIKCDISNT